MQVLSPDNASADLENYSTTIDSLLLKGSKKYDLYFYFSTYTKKYANHLLNLEEYLPEEYSTKVFDETILREGCSSSDNKLVALVIYCLILLFYY